MKQHSLTFPYSRKLTPHAQNNGTRRVANYFFIYILKTFRQVLLDAVSQHPEVVQVSSESSYNDKEIFSKHVVAMQFM